MRVHPKLRRMEELMPPDLREKAERGVKLKELSPEDRERFRAVMREAGLTPMDALMFLAEGAETPQEMGTLCTLMSRSLAERQQGD